MSRYYYSTDGAKVIGPISVEDMQRLYAAKILNDETQICEEGQSIWTSISEQVSLPRAQKVSESLHKLASQQREAPSKRRAEFPIATPRNPFLIPFIILAVLFIIAVGGGAFYIGRRGVTPQVTLSSPTPIPAISEATPTPEISEATPMPVVPTPQPTPAISEDTKSRVLDFIEKAAKIDNMTAQGVTYTQFTDQLAEVKSAWQTLTLVSWPETWGKEKAEFESAIDGWNLANEIWGKQIEVSSDSDAKTDFLFGAGKIYGPRLQAYAATLDHITDQNGLDKVHIPYDTNNPMSFDPDIVIKWCLSTSSICFQIARDGVKSHLSQGPQ
jgi:hypothetical protein